MTNYNPEFMKRAIELSRQGMLAGDGGPFGAVVVRGDEIIAEGNNQVLVDNDPTAHAEVTVIRKACKKLNDFQLEGCDIYTSCEPCPMCLGAIYWARPQAVYFANTKRDAADIDFDDSFIYDEIERPMNERKIKFVHSPSSEARQVFDEWQQKNDRTEY